MKLETAKAIVDEGGELTLYENYSGRGMYGKETAGIVGNYNEIIATAADVGIDSNEIRKFRNDNMGLSTIVY